MSLKYCNYVLIFFCVIYCFLSLLLILEHQPLKLSGVYFRCRLIIVQPKAIFLYVLNVCFFLAMIIHNPWILCSYFDDIIIFCRKHHQKKLTRTALSPNAMYNTCFLLLINIYLVLHHISIFFVVLLENDYAFA